MTPNETLRNIDEVEGDGLTASELRAALGIGSQVVLEAPPSDCRSTSGAPAWSKPLLRSWLTGELDATLRSQRTTERRLPA